MRVAPMSCESIAISDWRTTRCRSGLTLWRRCRAPPAARFCTAISTRTTHMIATERNLLDATPEPSTRAQLLNANDRALLAVNRALRALGARGFETQMLVCLSARIDGPRLRAALARVEQAEPVLASHLAAGR